MGASLPPSLPASLPTAVRAAVPAALVALLALWSGTFAGAASAAGAGATQLALLAVIGWAGGGRDPLRLRRAWWLPWALVATVALSMLLSPVPRAGWEAVLLLPAWLWLPSAMARGWRSRRPSIQPSDRALDRTFDGCLVLVALTVAAVALWGLAEWLAGGAPRPASPLGHHNLLAAWLVLTLPLVVLAAARRRGTAQGAARAALWAVVALALAAAVSTRSLTGLAALAIEALLAAWLVRPARRFALVATGLAVLAAVPRLVTLVSGGDPSGSGRRLFAEAAWRALSERPWLGHGPGSVGWLSALYLRSEPGISLPSEVVGQLHAVPLDLLFELGLIGTLAAAAVVAMFVRARWRQGQRATLARDRGAARAASIALAGGAVTALGNGWLEVPALTAALCLAAAVWLAASGSAAADERDGGASPALAGRAGERRWPGRLYALLACCLLLPLTVAQWRYDRAAALAPCAASSAAVAQAVARAVALDPAFPLYRARWAEALGAGAGGEASEPMALAWRAAQARRAAQRAVGVAALWLSAGRLEHAAGLASADSSLRRALALDPLAPYAAFERALSGHLPQREATECAARALLAEPRLAAALAFEQQPELLVGAAEEILGWQGIDAGWRQRMGQLLAAQQELRQAGSAPAGEDAVGRLVYGAEAGAAPGLSLYGFRRSPWPLGWLEVAVRLERARAFDLPPATRLATSSAAAFPPDRCAP